MATHTLGIIMYGVTGRMGLNQHLVRSIVAIREQGGVRLAEWRRVMPDPILVGRNAEKLAALARHTASRRSTTDLDAALDDPAYTVFFDAPRPRCAPICVHARDRSRQAHLLRKAERRQPRQGARGGEARQTPRGQERRGPGQALPARLAQDPGCFGTLASSVACSSVRGEFGYWVFEGDWKRGAAPVLELPQGGRRRHHPRHAVPLALRARQSVRGGEVGELPRGDLHPESGRRGGALRQGRRGRRRLRDLRARGRRDRAHQLIMVRAPAPR